MLKNLICVFSFLWFWLKHLWHVLSTGTLFYLPYHPTISPVPKMFAYTYQSNKSSWPCIWWSRWHYSLDILFLLPKSGMGISWSWGKKMFWIDCCSLPSSFISHSVIIFLSVVIGKIVTIPSSSLIAHLVKKSPAVLETLVWFLDWEDLLEKG